nr:uncharacterized protein LOC127487850 [Oryctolagus cuniculus]
MISLLSPSHSSLFCSPLFASPHPAPCQPLALTVFALSLLFPRCVCCSAHHTSAHTPYRLPSPLLPPALALPALQGSPCTLYSPPAPAGLLLSGFLSPLPHPPPFLMLSLAPCTACAPCLLHLYSCHPLLCDRPPPTQTHTHTRTRPCSPGHAHFCSSYSPGAIPFSPFFSHPFLLFSHPPCVHLLFPSPCALSAPPPTLLSAGHLRIFPPSCLLSQCSLWAVPCPSHRFPILYSPALNFPYYSALPFLLGLTMLLFSPDAPQLSPCSSWITPTPPLCALFQNCSVLWQSPLPLHWHSPTHPGCPALPLLLSPAVGLLELLCFPCSFHTCDCLGSCALAS